MFKKESIRNYWNKRARENKARTVGYNNRPLAKQLIEYAKKKEFIFKYCPRTYSTLDYGCGVGRHANEFNKYLGVDITEELVQIAREKYPNKQFINLSELHLPLKLDFDIELFFTATVLQHNPDDVVKKIFESISKIKQKNILFSLYENCKTDSLHMKSRSSEDYVALLKNYFKVFNYASHEHNLGSSQLKLTLIKV